LHIHIHEHLLSFFKPQATSHLHIHIHEHLLSFFKPQATTPPHLVPFHTPIFLNRNNTCPALHSERA